MINTTTLTQEQIKEINRVKIIRLIKEKDAITKQKIARELNLSIPTVTTNIKELLQEGIVEEAGVAKSTGGRKPVLLRFLKNARFSFGVNITTEKVEIILVNLNVEIIAKEVFKYDNKKDFNLVLQSIIDKVNNIIIKHNIDKNKILGIGMALPGLVDDDNLILEYGPNINVRNFSFKTFEKKIGLKVSIENEANIAAFAEISMSSVKDKDNIVYVSITEGVGTGIIIHNHIYKSNQKKAGEFGHIKISDEKIKCNCGRTGCWELYASTKALYNLFKKHTGIEAKSLKEIFKNITDEKVRKVIYEYGQNLLKGIENIILSLNPDYVIIGGELGEFGQEIISVLSNTEETCINFEGAKIVFSELKTTGSLIGAALLPLEELFNYKKNVI